MIRSEYMVVCLALAVVLPFGCGDDDGGVADAGRDAGNEEGDGSVEPGEWAVLVGGELFTDDLSMARARHDELAAGGQEAAMMAGDIAHDVKLGTTLLGTTENHFVAVDRWTDLDGLQAFYTNPDFAEAFGTLFSGPPTVEIFARTRWHQWGDLDAGDRVEPHWWVVIRGRLAATADDTQAAHDGLASAGQADAMMAGDIAHVVYLGVEDSREFLAFDIWQSDAAIESFYGNPDFMAAFGALFESPPAVGVYWSTDWHQW